MRTVIGTLVASLALAVAVPALSQDKTQTTTQTQDLTKDQDRELTKLRDRIHKETKIKEADLDPFQAELREYFRLHGDADHLQATLRFSAENGCMGECLGEMVRSMNRAMVHGMQDAEAERLVCDSLRDRIQTRDRDRLKWTDSQLADQVRTRTRDRLQDWQRDHDRTMRDFMDREQMRERDRDQIHRTGGGRPGR